MVNVAFRPSNLSITRGTTVTWKNGDSDYHSVTSATGSVETYDSGLIGDGATFSHSFATPGIFAYYCTNHGVNGSPPTGMHGTVTVN